jgi:glycosyltransferase involved in cell wall biosynthesis
MNIGIDAKRIFNNPTGLGVYGRNLVAGFQQIHPQHTFTLFTPSSESTLFNKHELNPNFKIVESKALFSYYWRSYSIYKDILKNKIDIYHGLSNELPFSISKAKIKSIVDIHDLCFVRFPEDYSNIDQKIFIEKATFAAKNSNKIIATSEATKIDIITYLKVPESKIAVVYQCCDAQFYKTLSAEEKEAVKIAFSLPENYFLCVGTIQGRKNQKSIVKAISLLPKSEQYPLVLVGNGGKYLEELLSMAAELKVIVHVLKNVPFQNLPSIYALAKLFIYPSFIEGFGIPVLEAMACKVPLITSENTSMAEIVKNDKLLINLNDVHLLKEKISELIHSDTKEIVEQNYQSALQYSQSIFANQVLKIYEEL